jgi:hypothetical protein
MYFVCMHAIVVCAGFQAPQGIVARDGGHDIAGIAAPSLLVCAECFHLVGLLVP